MNKKHYVYIVRCHDNTYYTGYSTDVPHRIKIHNAAKGAKYTRSRLPVTLVYIEECRDVKSALRRERAIKKMARKDKIELIKINPLLQVDLL